MLNVVNFLPIISLWTSSLMNFASKGSCNDKIEYEQGGTELGLAKYILEPAFLVSRKPNENKIGIWKQSLGKIVTNESFPNDRHKHVGYLFDWNYLENSLICWCYDKIVTNVTTTNVT